MTEKQADFAAIFERLKTLLQRYDTSLTVTHDEPGTYSLDAGYSDQYKRNLFFGSVQIKKNYVSYYLMPVYVRPELAGSISMGLSKRMQGKSCFNFKQIDETLFHELADLTEKGFEYYRSKGWVE